MATSPRRCRQQSRHRHGRQPIQLRPAAHLPPQRRRRLLARLHGPHDEPGPAQHRGAPAAHHPASRHPRAAGHHQHRRAHEIHQPDPSPRHRARHPLTASRQTRRRPGPHRRRPGLVGHLRLHPSHLRRHPARPRPGQPRRDHLADRQPRSAHRRRNEHPPPLRAALRPQTRLRGHLRHARAASPSDLLRRPHPLWAHRPRRSRRPAQLPRRRRRRTPDQPTRSQALHGDVDHHPKPHQRPRAHGG